MMKPREVTDAFTAIADGVSINIPSGRSMIYEVTGTFVGTWILERSDNAGESWQQEDTGTAGKDPTLITVPVGNERRYRFRCSAFTSGSIDTSIHETPIIVQALHWQTLASIKDKFQNVGASEEEAAAIVVPAGVLKKNGDALRMTAWGEGAPNVNAKVVRPRARNATTWDFGSFALTASQNAQWQIITTIEKQGPELFNVEQINYEHFSGVTAPPVRTGSFDATFFNFDSEAFRMYLTLDGVAADDVTFRGALFEALILP